MLAAPLIKGGTQKFQTKISGGDLSKKLNCRVGAKFKGGSKILGEPVNPNDPMVVVLKDILLCLLGFRFMYIVYIS